MHQHPPPSIKERCIMLTELQRSILEFAKQESFHGTLREFIDRYHIDENIAIQALRDLKSKRIVSMNPNIMNSWIGMTNYGYKVMGW